MLDLLPLDVAATIAAQLSSQERAQLAVVSKFCHLVSVTGIRQICVKSQSERQLESILAWLQSLHPHCDRTLRSLQINHSGVSLKFWPDTASLAHFQHLTELYLGQAKDSENAKSRGSAALTRRTIRNLARLPKLQKLGVVYSEVSTDQEDQTQYTLSEFATLGQLTELRLRIRTEPGSVADVVLSSCLQGLHTLKNLEIYDARIRINSTLRSMAGRLEKLVLDSIVRTSNDQAIAAPNMQDLQIWQTYAAYHSALFITSADLRRLEIHAASFPDLREALPAPHSSLTKLILNEFNASIEDLSILSLFSSLETLHICLLWTRIPVMDHFVHLSRLSKLTVTSETDEVLPLCYPQERFTSLRDLNLTMQHAFDLGDMAYALPKLESLSLDFILAADSEEESNEHLIAGQSLERVYVTCGSSVVHYGRAPPAITFGNLPKLHSLSVDMRDLRSKDTMAICSGIAQMRSLTSFCFSHSKSVLHNLPFGKNPLSAQYHRESLDCVLASLRHLPALHTLELVAPDESLQAKRSWLQNVQRLGLCCKKLDLEHPFARESAWPAGAVFIRTGPYSCPGSEDDLLQWERDTMIYRDSPGHALTAIKPADIPDFKERCSKSSRYCAFYKDRAMGVEAWEPQTDELKHVKRHVGQ